MREPKKKPVTPERPAARRVTLANAVAVTVPDELRELIGRYCEITNSDPAAVHAELAAELAPRLEELAAPIRAKVTLFDRKLEELKSQIRKGDLDEIVRTTAAPESAARSVGSASS